MSLNGRIKAKIKTCLFKMEKKKKVTKLQPKMWKRVIQIKKSHE